MDGHKMLKKTKSPSKKYLKHRVSSFSMMFFFLIGLLSGAYLGHLFYGSSKNDVIHLTMVYSSEKNTWISQSQQLFYEYWNEKRAHNSSLKPITLDFQPYGSGDSLISLLNGEIKPIIWSPASNIWVPILNAKWKLLTESDTPLVENYTRLIYSPVVIATWEDFAKVHPIHSLHDLHDVIVNSSGTIKMAHTDPRESNSGFMTTIMFVSSYLQMDPSLMSLANISDPSLIQWMKEIESAAIFYGKSTGFLGRYMRDQGPSALQIAFLYENLVQDYSLSAEKHFGQKIISIYPEEGVLFSDHPFCILNADWVSAEQKMVAEEYLRFLASRELMILAIKTGFRPINSSLLDDPEIKSVYLESFNWDHGVTDDPSIIKELKAPLDGNLINRIPDLWILTRNTV